MGYELAQNYDICYNSLHVKGERKKLNISTDRIDDCQLRLNVEVEQERVDQYLKDAAKRLAGKVRLPGFRKGKAPYNVLVQMLGKEALYEESLEELGQQVYAEALEKEGIEPFAQAQLENVSFEPMSLKFLIPLPPKIELNDYREIRIESREEIVITDDEVANALEQMREARAEWATVNRPLAEGDLAVTHIKISVGEQVAADDDRTFIVDTSSAYPVPGFQSELVGMQAGETKAFELTYPPDWEEEELAGSLVHCEVELKEVKEKVLPELDDEFAALVGDYESLDDVKAHVAEDLKEHARHAALHKFEDDALAKLVEGADIVFPPVMLEEQIDEMIRERDMFVRSQQGVSLEDFLKMVGQTMDEVRAKLADSARVRLQRSLAIGKLAELEKLQVTAEEMRVQEQVMLDSLQGEAGPMRELLATPQGQAVIRRDVLSRKSLERLVAIAKGEAPEIAADTPEEPADVSAVPQVEADQEQVSAADPE